VFVCLCEIATHHKVDLDKALDEKLSDLSLRAPKWRIELKDALRRARNGHHGQDLNET
jgi:hypothetical protein